MRRWFAGVLAWGHEVVCCTSIGAAAGFLTSFTFPKVLVDEAAQATEPATLVPICRGCEALVLVGDQCQLPPTVSSDAAARAGLSRSLFERLLRGGLEATLLSVQYRMHPALSGFPNTHFYAGRIADGVSPAARPLVEGVPWPKPECPVSVVSVEGRERAESTSFVNDAEAAAVKRIVVDLVRAGLPTGAMGVVAPYAAQVFCKDVFATGARERERQGELGRARLHPWLRLCGSTLSGLRVLPNLDGSRERVVRVASSMCSWQSFRESICHLGTVLPFGFAPPSFLRPSSST